MTTIDLSTDLIPADHPLPLAFSPGALLRIDLSRSDSLDSYDGEPFPEESDPDRLDALIISDIHLGSDNCQAKAATALLQQILDGEIRTRRLIINGDVFDSIDFRRLKKTHWKVLSQIRHLSDKLEVVWIVGNHDGSAEIISHLLGVQVVEQFILHSGDRRLLVVHGHQYDGFIQDHPILTWLADTGYWLLQKIDRSHYVARLAKTRSKTFIRCASKIRTGAARRAAEQGCSGVVCGHTHHVEKSEDGPGVAYYNSGCWTENPCTYLAVQGGRVEVKTWSEALVAV